MSEYKEKQNVSIFNVIANTFLAVLKLVFGALYKSSAVISDGINSFTDAIGNVIVIVGTKFAHAPPDDKHNYGHEKIETIISFLLALFMAGAGVYLCYSAVLSLVQKNSQTLFSPILIIVSALSVIFKETMFRKTIKCAKKYNSALLKADAWNYRADSFSSFAVLIGVIAGYINKDLYFIEHIATIVVSVLLIKVAFDIIKDSVDRLIDKAADKPTLEKIKEIILGVEGVCHIDELRSRISTYKVFVDVEIAVDGTISLEEAHKIAEEVHDTLEHNYTEFNIKHIQVHVNPYKI